MERFERLFNKPDESRHVFGLVMTIYIRLDSFLWLKKPHYLPTPIIYHPLLYLRTGHEELYTI